MLKEAELAKTEQLKAMQMEHDNKKRFDHIDDA